MNRLVNIVVRITESIFWLYIGVFATIFRPIWTRIENFLSPTVTEVNKAKTVVKHEFDRVWSNRWKILGVLVAATVIIGYLLFQAIIFYFVLYNVVLITPVQERIEKPLHFKFDSPERIKPPHSTLILTKDQITPSQGYEIKVMMTMPESTTNFEIGMFMVNINLTYTGCRKETCATEMAAQSNRHAVLRWKSGLLRTLYTLFYSIPLLFGISMFEEKQYFTLVMFEEFFFNPGIDADSLLVDVSISDPNLQLYTAKLLIHAKLHGLSYYCYYYYYTSMFIGTIIIFSFELCFTLIFIAFLISTGWKSAPQTSTSRRESFRSSPGRPDRNSRPIDQEDSSDSGEEREITRLDDLLDDQNKSEESEEDLLRQIPQGGEGDPL